jgi:hypothetical protein
MKMSEKANPILWKGKTEAEINEFLQLEGELIIELDKLSTPVKRAILANFKEMAKLPEWVQTILLEDINTAVVNRIGTMQTIIESQKQNEPYAPKIQDGD